MTFVQLLDLVGVAVFAVSGALAAVRKRLDLLGVVVIAMVTAIGGGTTRDLLLDRAIFWTTQPRYLYVILISALLTVFWTRRFKPPDRALAIADALGLALFSISGAQIAERLGVAPVPAFVMGVLTACAGGIIRDVLANEPSILMRPELYVTAAALASGLFVILAIAGAPAALAALVAGLAGFSLRAAAIARGLKLPAYDK